MPIQGIFELPITVNSQEEMDKIAEAILSGLAENCIKDRVLWNSDSRKTIDHEVVQESLQKIVQTSQSMNKEMEKQFSDQVSKMVQDALTNAISNFQPPTQSQESINRGVIGRRSMRDLANRAQQAAQMQQGDTQGGIPPISESTAAKKAEEAPIELKRIETKVKAPVKPVEETPPPEPVKKPRSTSILGRGRMRRT